MHDKFITVGSNNGTLMNDDKMKQELFITPTIAKLFGPVRKHQNSKTASNLMHISALHTIRSTHSTQQFPFMCECCFQAIPVIL